MVECFDFILQQEMEPAKSIEHIVEFAKLFSHFRAPIAKVTCIIWIMNYQPLSSDFNENITPYSEFGYRFKNKS